MDKFVGSSEKNLREIFDNPPDRKCDVSLHLRLRGVILKLIILQFTLTSRRIMVNRCHKLHCMSLYWMSLTPLLALEADLVERASREMLGLPGIVWSISYLQRWMVSDINTHIITSYVS